MIYKILAVILTAALLALGAYTLYQNHKHGKQITKLSNQIAQQQKTIKTTKTAYSKLALINDSLSATNKDLNNIIAKSNQQILAKTQAYLKLKEVNKTIKAKQTQLQTNRTRVDFDLYSPPTKVLGYTLTNPPEASIRLSYDSIKLEILLTQANNTWHTHVDTNNPDITIDLDLQVNPEVLKPKWYQKIAFQAGIGINKTLTTHIAASYQITSKIHIGPVLYLHYPFSYTAGATIIYFPF